MGGLAARTAHRLGPPPVVALAACSLGPALDHWVNGLLFKLRTARDLRVVAQAACSLGPALIVESRASGSVRNIVLSQLGVCSGNQRLIEGHLRQSDRGPLPVGPPPVAADAALTAW